MVEVVEDLFSKHEALSSIPSTAPPNYFIEYFQKIFAL
jgi:hypothetical protein